MQAVINLLFILVSWTVSSQDLASDNIRDKLGPISNGLRYVLAYGDIEPNYRSIEIKGFYAINKRTFKSTGVTENASCGHCTESSSAINSQVLVSGLGLGVNFSQRRFYSTVEISVEQYAHNIEARYSKVNYHPHLPWGSIDDQYREMDHFSAREVRLKILGGVGVRILHPRHRFNVIPIIKLASGFSIKKTINEDYYEKNRVYEWTGSLTPETNFAWDSTFTPSRVTSSSRNIDLMVGFGFTFRAINNFRLNADIFYSAYSTEIINIPSVEITDKLRIYSSIGIGYEIPLKSRFRKQNHGSGRSNE